MPQGRIELPTSPLPRVRSTTELLRRCGAVIAVFAGRAQAPPSHLISPLFILRWTGRADAARERVMSDQRTTDTSQDPAAAPPRETTSQGGSERARPRRAPSPQAAEEKATREARLAEALRANLRRRKDRARAAKAAPAASAPLSAPGSGEDDAAR